MIPTTPGAVFLKPGARPQCVPVPVGLTDLKNYVEGHIEALYHWLPEHPGVLAYGNDEARLLGMPPSLYRQYDEQVLVGPLIFVGDDGQGDERALTDDEERAVLDYIERNNLSKALPGQTVTYTDDAAQVRGVVQDLIVDRDNVLHAAVLNEAGITVRVALDRIQYNEEAQ
jgi:hypothetical protein